MEQAKKKNEELAERLLQQAHEKLLEAEGLRAGSGGYNLACLAAIKGNTSDALHWLQLARSKGARLSMAQIEAENDFDRVRNDSDFMSLMKSLSETTGATLSSVGPTDSEMINTPGESMGALST
jgi:hypothetical protein